METVEMLIYIGSWTLSIALVYVMVKIVMAVFSIDKNLKVIASHYQTTTTVNYEAYTLPVHAVTERHPAQMAKIFEESTKVETPALKCQCPRPLTGDDGRCLACGKFI